MISESDIDNLCAAHLSGKTLDDIRKTFGIGKVRITQILRSRGYTIRKGKRPFIKCRKNIALNDNIIEDIATRYLAGASANGIAQTLEITRNAVHRALTTKGIPQRSNAEANRLMMSKRSPAENAKNTIVAHDTVRGVAQPDEVVRQRAIRCQLSTAHTSPEEIRFACLLKERGLTIIQQKAVERYNIDIAVLQGRIAVEICGGGYSKEVKANFRKRLDVLINNNWTPIMIAVSAKRPFTQAAIDYVIAVSQVFCKNPTLVRQEHVITGHAQPTAIFKRNVDYNAAIGGDKCGNIISGPDGRFCHDAVRMEWWMEHVGAWPF